MDNLPITLADAIILGILLISGLLAYARGFVHETLSVAGWIGAGFATLYGLPLLKPHVLKLIPTDLGPISDYISVDVVAGFVTGVVIFIVTLVVLSMLTRVVSNRVQSSTLNFLDRSLGFLYGLARGAVIVCSLYLALTWLMPHAEQPKWVQDARAMPLVEAGADLLRSLVPMDLAKTGSNAANQARDNTKKLLETQKVLGDMLSNKTDTAPGPERKGYRDEERLGLERLIESNKQ